MYITNWVKKVMIKIQTLKFIWNGKFKYTLETPKRE